MSSFRRQYYTVMQAVEAWCWRGFDEVPAKLITDRFCELTDALIADKLPFTAYGQSAGAVIHPDDRIIAHADLREWMRHEHPEEVDNQAMAWLFADEWGGASSVVSVAEHAATKAELTATKSKNLAANRRDNMLRVIHALRAITKIDGRYIVARICQELPAGPSDDTVRD
ncbi:MAG: hypothetical protein LBQ20_12580, partial [Rhodanobacter sp.]|nr:hypothetical protein [Rhodanobacter sp.]